MRDAIINLMLADNFNVLEVKESERVRNQLLRATIDEVVLRGELTPANLIFLLQYYEETFNHLGKMRKKWLGNENRLLVAQMIFEAAQQEKEQGTLTPKRVSQLLEIFSNIDSQTGYTFVNVALKRGLEA